MNRNFEDNEFFRQLPEETKEKIRNCKTEDEAMDLLKGKMIPISDDALNSVAGGHCYSDSMPCPSDHNSCSENSIE